MLPIPAVVRAAVVLRDGGCCVLCGGRDAQHCHHLRSRGAGGGMSPDNLVMLCVVCHARVHADPDAKRALMAECRRRGILPPEV